jgi:serine/threonine protein kinase
MRHLLGKTLGNYHLKRILGQGRMGIVFLAIDKALLRPTALKIMAWSMENESTEDPIRWFLSEARSVARISHPNVIQIYNIARHDEYRYIAMEYIDGESAERTLERKGRFSTRHATEILVQTCDALDAAHQVGVIHRDIKPANLLLRKDGIVKLSDFGMAMSSYTHTVFTANMRVGTPFFNAPETWTGRPASPASDIYALGVTYYMLLTGKLPFQAKTMEELRQAHLSRTPIDPRNFIPDLPAQCAELTLKCLSKKDFQRYVSATDLRNAAQELLEQISDGRRLSRVSQISFAPALGDTPQSEYATASETWMQLLNFHLEPFAAVNPLDCPYKGEPLNLSYEHLKNTTSNGGKIVFFHGEEGSGRTTLLQQHALQTGTECAVIFLRSEKENSSRSLIESLCKLSGIHPSKDTVLHELEHWLARDADGMARHTLIYADDIIDSEIDVEELQLLIQIVQRIEQCTLIVCTRTSNLDLIRSRIPIENFELIDVPALSPNGVQLYIREWIEKTRTFNSPLLIFSTDAVLWIAHKCQGNLSKINSYVRGILRIAGSSTCNVISSWEAWYCGQQLERGNRLPHEFPKCAADWPTPEVLQVLNSYRQTIGIDPLFKSFIPNRKPTQLGQKEKSNE